MSSLGIEGLKVLKLGATLLCESSVLSAGRLDLGLGQNDLNIGLLPGVSYQSLSCCFRLIDQLDDLSLNLRIRGVLLTLNLSDQNVADLFCLNNGYLLIGVRCHPQLILLDLRSVNL